MPSKKVDKSPIPEVAKSGSLAGKAIEFAEKYLILPDSRKPLVLHAYQRELFEQWADTGTMAHLTVIGAGNAKTTTLSAFVTACLYLTDEASIPVVAETVQQAVLTTWGRSKRFIELSPELLKRTEILEGQGSRRGLFVSGMNGHCYPIADRPDGLQGLIPGPVAVLEETSEATMETFSALMSRMGKRPGKVVGISTPSFTEDNALLQVQRAMRSGDPMPGVTLTEYISDQTDHRDESQWYKASPGLITDPPVLDINALRTAVALLPEMTFRAYRLCQNPTGSESCWLNSLDDTGTERGDAYDVWKSAAVSYTFTKGAPTFVGCDIAKSRDHAAVVWGQFREDGRLHVKCRIWTPTKTADIDLEEIADHLNELAREFDVRSIWYDPSYFYNAPLLAKTLPMIEVPPSEARMAPIVGHCYQAVRRLRITHDDQEQFTKEVLAGKRKYGSNGFTIEKRQFTRKIDAAVALVLCHAAASGFETPDPEAKFIFSVTGAR